MPVYDYDCADCGAFEVVRRIAERDAPVACPQCGAPAARVTIAAPSVGGASSFGDGARVHAAGVDEMVHKAIAAGGKHAMDPVDHGFMYGWSFYDLDGHHWLFSQHARDLSPDEWGVIMAGR